MERHPAERFLAPASIERGVPLKELIGRELIALVGESLAAAAPGFDAQRFRARAMRGLNGLALKARAAHVARAMAEQLPADFDELAPVLIRSFGPALVATEGNGLAPFFYFPHAHLIAERGVARFESGMRANRELTMRFTAEFSLRPFLVEQREACLRILEDWARDANPHVRRAASEGTRPRLPWAARLPELQQNPWLALPILETLKDDPELYVRRSVANHLGDIAKDHLEFACAVCEQWLEKRAHLPQAVSENRKWIVRHALRHPARRGVARAVRIRTRAAARKASRLRTGRSL